MLINSILVGMHKKNHGLNIYVWVIIVSIIVLMPFHAFLTAWFGSNFGHFDAIRLWKEALLASLLIGSAVLLYKDKKLRADIADSWLFRIGILFCLWIGLMTMWGVYKGTVGDNAAGYGLIIDTRPVLFLLVSFIAARSYKSNKQIPLYIIIPAVAVITFGLLQFLLPSDFLRHFGYSSDTLRAFQTVDNKPDLVRLQSTLRGPNPLGAYLVFAGLIALSYKFLKKSHRYLFFGSLAVVLFGTYSRSAWLGGLAGVFTYVLLRTQGSGQRRKLYLACGVLLVTFSLGILALRNNDFVQNVFFHTNEQSTSLVSSNTARFEGLNSGLKEAYSQPFGKGVGAAGPASAHNTKRPAHINENYFLQIAEEAGWIGLVLFLSFLGVLAVLLYKRRRESLACALFAVLIATAIINMVSHAWADDTLAYLLFGTIGLFLAKENSTKSEKKVYT